MASETSQCTTPIPNARPITTTNPSVKMVIMNCGGNPPKEGDTDKGGNTLMECYCDKRRQAVSNVISKQLPHVALFQKFQTQDIKDENWKNYPIPNYYMYKPHAEASIMYDARMVDVDVFDEKRLDNELRLSKSFATVPVDFPRSRMTMARVSVPITGVEFMCVSWHGPHNKLTEEKPQANISSKGGQSTEEKHQDNSSSKGGQMPVENRQNLFKYLMEVLLLVKKGYNIPLIIGGDFNIEMSEIKKFVKDPFQLCRFKQSGSRHTDLIDYFICSEEIQLHDMTRVNFETDTYVEDPYKYLNHDPFVAELTMTLKKEE